MLNVALTTPYPKLNDTLIGEKSFVVELAGLMEHSSIVIRGKSLLTFLLLFKMNSAWLALVAEHKFYPILDRLLRDNFKYVQFCLVCLMEGVQELIPSFLAQIREEFDVLTGGPANEAAQADEASLKIV